MAKMKRWKPIRKGKLFCSPECGGNCTHAAYRRAVSESKDLAKKLGPEWVTRVWENLGWHWRVERGAFNVRLHEPEYMAEFYDRATGRQWLHLGKTPEAAILSVQKSMLKYLQLIEKAVRKAQQV